MIRVVAAARGAQTSDGPAAPPERVWRHITREVLHESDGLPDPRWHPGRPSPVRRTSVRRSARSAGSGAREGFLVLVLATGVPLVRWLRAGQAAGLPAAPVRLPRVTAFVLSLGCTGSGSRLRTFTSALERAVHWIRSVCGCSGEAGQT